MDPGYIVVVIFGVIVVATALGVGLVVIVLSGIRGEHAQWPVRNPPRREGRRAEIAGHERRAEELGAAATAETPQRPAEHPEWTSRDLAGDDLRPVGTHAEKHALPGHARWW